MLPTIGPLRPWADPTVVAIGRLPMHTPFVAPPDRRLSLDGEWAFELFGSPDDVPADAVTGPHPVSWAAQPVPGNWTVAHDRRPPADPPIYTNIAMPFAGPPPALPVGNPTGVYRCTFELPPPWRGDNLILHIGAADSVHAVYVNGMFAGYGTDSRLPSEYEITPLLVAGLNTLAVAVVRFSAHSYVEDQDQWWMAGLHRQVFLERRPATAIVDVAVDAALRLEDGCGLLDVATTISFEAPAPGWSVVATLSAPDGTTVATPAPAAVPHEFATPYLFSGHIARSHAEIPAVRPWSAESPSRYLLTLELVDTEGAVADIAAQWIGFRTVQVSGGRLRVNGQPIRIFGVNRHDHHPDRGKAVTVDDMRADLAAMRAHNVTAVRASHYPNDSGFLDLCDELGMYVVDEANIESHAYNTTLCADGRYLAAWLDRGSRMVQRDRNHPCVIAWSLGNESGYGSNHDALAGWIRRDDPSRPLHYEGAIFHDGWDGGRAATDIVCPMYPPIDAIAAYRGERPLIMCEYSHAMGNSNGSLADYWDTIETTPGLQGGFLWEWKDHGLRQYLPDGTVRLAYGGQFGERHHDGNFVADGLMSAELTAHPAMSEVAWVYRPVSVHRAAGDGLAVTNRQSFTGVDALGASWELLLDGHPIAGGAWALPAIAPQTTAVVPLPCALPDEPGELHLTLRFTADGRVAAWDQVELRSAATVPSDGVPADIVQPVLQLWRAPTDNDGFKLMPWISRWGGKAMKAWHQAGLDSQAAEQLVRHTMERDGPVYRHRVTLPDGFPTPGRVGVAFTLPSRFSRLRWFGRGPGENYPDRNRGSLLGIWEGPPDECPYLVPQEFGLRTDCRWFECIDPTAGETVRFEAVEPAVLHYSATHHTAADLAAAATIGELRRRDELIVHLDTAHRGLGTASCGPDVLPQYELTARHYDFSYRAVWLAAGDTQTSKKRDAAVPEPTAPTRAPSASITMTTVHG